MAQMPPRSDGARWVPRDAIKVQPGLTPRDRMIDEDHVARLAENKDALPPLLVQAGTLVLIGGHHRLYALEGRDIVPVVEVEVADDDLWDWAVRDNVGHGLPASTKERNRNARKMWERHPDWSAAKLAEWSGCHQSTFAKWNAEARHMAAQREESEKSYVQDTDSEFHYLQNAPSGRPEKVVGRDGVRRPKTTDRPTNESIRASRPVVKTFDPGCEVPPGVDPETGEVFGEDAPEVEPSNAEMRRAINTLARKRRAGVHGGKWWQGLPQSEADEVCEDIEDADAFMALLGAAMREGPE
ncbi:MAG: hypothetical protein AB7I13_05960 [Vicinamibacterales bacterium]